MNKKALKLSFKLIFLSFLLSCSPPDNLVIHHQVTGLIETNSYLLYSEQSKEGALFDVGGNIDSLESIIREKGINLKYIFITHCHPDHVFGVPAIKKRYPEVKICFSRKEYEDTKNYAEWEKNLDSAFVVSVKEDPGLFELMNFDFKLLGKPKIELADNQIYKLGGLEIKTFLSSGHSRGSICFYADGILLSGDVLFFRSVGRSDLPKSGSKEDIIKSVRRLYKFLPDETKVYPGHGQFTDIGTEKKENKKISLNTVNI